LHKTYPASPFTATGAILRSLLQVGQQSSRKICKSATVRSPTSGFLLAEHKHHQSQLLTQPISVLSRCAWRNYIAGKLMALKLNPAFFEVSLPKEQLQLLKLMHVSC
jgi:hypothetical protein